MKTKILISILIPNYNRGKLLGETLDSILAQTYPHWEAIIVDDGSTDHSEETGLKYAAKDERISFFHRDREPSGAPTCRNLAFQKSKGEYVIYLDSDDLLAEHCLEQRLGYIEQNPGLDFLVFPMLIFSKTPEDANYLWNKPNGESDLLRFLKLDASWQTSGPIWKREAVAKMDGFTEGLACWQDVDFHLKALGKQLPYQIFDQAKPDIFYRRHIEGSISQGEISTPPKMKTRLDIFIRHTTLLPNFEQTSIRLAAKELGSNVVFGAIKSHYFDMAKKAIRHGSQMGIFSTGFVLKSIFLFLVYSLRINKIPRIEPLLMTYIRKNRSVSSIGKHPYKEISL